jgi:hypothetical protein
MRTGRRPVHERRARDRRVLLVGLAISLALHLLLIPLAGRWLEPEVRYSAGRPEAPPVAPDGAIRAVALSATGDEDQPEPDREAEPLVPGPPAAVGPAQPDRRDRDAAYVPTERRTAAERLAPRVVDPRFWRPMVVLPADPTLQDVQDRVAAAMEMLSDSALAETERALRARDWTVEDRQGGRWGISPGQIHLGSLTLPLPLFFPVDTEAEARQALWYELETQLDRTEFLESFDARVRAIRERRDRERSERRSPETTGG